MRLVGLLGGTFDPVHCGHLRVAIESRELLALEEVLLMPAGAPRLREPPQADGRQRLRMLRDAVRGQPGLRVDGRELQRAGPTRTVDTLRELRHEQPGDAFVLILGADAFARLTRWADWRSVARLAHLLVVRRPGARLPGRGELADFVQSRRVHDAARLRRRRAGLLMVADLPRLDISATRIRALLAAGRSVRFLVPDPVLPLLTSSGAYDHARQ